MATTKTADRLDPAFVKLAWILLIGVVAVTFDTTIVNVALDAIGRDLQATVSATQWTITAFVLAMAMIMPISGWAMSRFGDKQVWLFSLVVFLLGSVLSAIAPNVDLLIAFRVVQGVGGGLMVPTMQTILVVAAGGRSMGRVMALTSIVAVTGPILGPVVGGVITSYLNWRWIFWINIPCCVAGFLLAWRALQSTESRSVKRFDMLGFSLLSPALAALIYGLSQVGNKSGLADPMVSVPLVIGVLLLAGYTWHALRTSGHPIIDLRLFKARSFSASTIMWFLSGLSLYGAMFLLPLYYQQERGQSALVAGLLLAPQGLGSLLIRGQTGKLADRIGPRPVVLFGYTLAVLGTFAHTQAGPDTNELLLGLSLVVRGAGLGAVAIPIMASAYQDLTPKQMPDASSATRIMQLLGGSFGTAIIAVLLQTQLAAHQAEGLAGQATAFNTVFWWSLAFTALAVIPAFALPGRSK